MDELITVAQILKAQGLRGELKLKPYTNDLERFRRLKAVLIDSAAFRIVSLRINEPFVYLKLAGVDTREQAETLRDKLVLIERVHAIDLDDDEFFVADLIGCHLFLDGEESGIITDILQHGAADVIEVELCSGGKLLFPFLKKLNLQIDVQKKRVCADKKAVDMLAVYERVRDE